ncbi:MULTISPECIES: hypothetical protein [Acidithiobacillus]|uniref:Uncharacterized protein n=1 Tax=Acidithiobacillus ferruginosus TaxID=3063951 RepID=A0ACD5IKI5_9PROT
MDDLFISTNYGRAVEIMRANSPLVLLTCLWTSLQDKAQDMVMFRRKKLFRKEVVGLLMALLCAITGLVDPRFAAAQISSDPADACSFLARNVLPVNTSEQQAVQNAEALEPVPIPVPVYLDPPEIIARVAHIPGAPYLTAISGNTIRCVAIAPQWLLPLSTPERTWLILVGIANSQDPHTYHLLVLAADNQLAGWLSGLTDWFGKRAAHQAILRSETQATIWLARDHGDAVGIAGHALLMLGNVPTFATNPWLPSLVEQLAAIGKAVIAPG